VFLDLYKYYDDEEYAAYGSAWIASKINEISGTKKADSLVGTDWQDDINGMAGNDKIVGGKNQDVLTGGSGNDTFIYRSILESVPDLADIITDFQKGDKIDLKAIDADINQKNDQAFTKPIIVEEFSGIFTKTKQLVFATSTEKLYGNVDNDEAADFSIEISGVNKLISTDLVL
jgi:hypothetical protein